MDGTTTTTTGGAGEEQWGSDAPTAEQTQLLATAVGDQCASCGARLAGDQRYCVECGERRGKPRYRLPGSGAGGAGKPAASRASRRPRFSSNATLIAGVGTLLLAMGVGVLIGRTSNTSSPGTGGVQVVTIAGGAGGATASTTPATSSAPGSTASGSTSSNSTSKSKSKGGAASVAAKLPTKAKTIPKKLKSSVEKQGQKCTSATKGCTNGKFTGTFFGGG